MTKTYTSNRETERKVVAIVSGFKMAADGEWLPWEQTVKVVAVGPGTTSWAKLVARAQIGQPVLAGPGRKDIREVRVIAAEPV